MIRAENIDILVTGALYALFAGGLLLSRSAQFKTLLTIIATRRRLYLGNRVRAAGAGAGSAADKHIAALMRVVFKRKHSVNPVKAVSALLFLCMLFSGMRSVSLSVAVLPALAAGLTPYILLRIRAETIKRRGSREGERLVAAFLNQYRIANYNIYETLEKLVAGSEQFRICGGHLFKLLLEIRNAGNGEKLHRATEAFARATDTNWGRMLAYNIRLGAGRGMNVSPGIEDILVQLRDARTVMEESKRLNAESSRIVIFFAPLLYIGSILLSVRFLGLPLRTLVRNQLGTPEGFMLLVLIAVLFVVNLILLEFVMNQKMDY
jgi:hypothetical protein